LESDYLGAIEAAGFQEVRVVDTIRGGGDSIEDDPTASAIAQSTDLTDDTNLQLAKSVLSIKVSAIKPV
jgi:hypothetical protein